MSLEDIPLTVTIPELADLLDCTRQHLWNQVRAGNIRTTRPLGRIQRVGRPEVIRILNGEPLVAE
jgi:hypothetical protein